MTCDPTDAPPSLAVPVMRTSATPSPNEADAESILTWKPLPTSASSGVAARISSSTRAWSTTISTPLKSSRLPFSAARVSFTSSWFCRESSVSRADARAARLCQASHGR